MAVQPIDLQTVFMQSSLVGKEQQAAQQGAVIQADLQGVREAVRTETRNRRVNETSEDGANAGKVNADGKNKRQGGREAERRKGDDESSPDDTEDEGADFDDGLMRESFLGQNVDLDG